MITLAKRRRLTRTYRYVQTHPIGRWALAATWIGLGLCSFMILAFVPIILERRDVLRAAGLHVK